MNKKVDIFIRNNPLWAKEFARLREIILEENFEETLKWGKPAYRYNNENILLIHGFKEYCAILFFNGSTLDDSQKLLVAQTANVVSARQIRFNSLSSIKENEKALRELIAQSRKNTKSNDIIKAKIEVPTAIADELSKTPGLLEAFLTLSPGKQRGYLLHFSSGKKPITLTNRVNKNSKNIFEQKPFN